MNIYVIMKRTFDTEEKIILKDGQISEDSVSYIINPYDEYAVEEALFLREQHDGEVTVVTVGNEDVEKELRTALAMGADKAVLINNEDLDSQDQFTSATILGAYLKDKDVDIILAGNTSIDSGTGQVGPRLAEILNIAQVTTITNLEITDGKATVVRDVEGDQETIEVSLPVLLTAQQGLNEPRYPSLPGIMKAKKKPLEKLDLDDLDLDSDELQVKTRTIKVTLPAKKGSVNMLDGEPQAQVKNLVSLLTTQAQVI